MDDTDNKGQEVQVLDGNDAEHAIVGPESSVSLPRGRQREGRRGNVGVAQNRGLVSRRHGGGK